MKKGYKKVGKRRAVKMGWAARREYRGNENVG